MTHEVKSHHEAFQQRWDGFKPWEFRRNDRKYQVGDFLHEREWNPVTERYTKRSILSKIICLYDGKEPAPRKFGIPKDFCIMTLETIARGPEEAAR